jgi:hypothetical protein
VRDAFLVRRRDRRGHDAQRPLSLLTSHDASSHEVRGDIMKRFLLIAGVMILLVTVIGFAVIEPIIGRKLTAAQSTAVGTLLVLPMVDDLLGAAQFENENRALFVARYHDGTNQVVRVGVLDLDTGKVGSQKVLEDRAVQYLGQGDGVGWFGSTDTGLHARSPTGDVLVDQKQLVAKNPKLGIVPLLTDVDEGAYVDETTGGLLAPRAAGDLLIDPKTFVAAAANASRVKRQQVSGTVPIAKLSTGQMLSSVQASGGYYFGINGKQVVTDVQQRMYQQKYLIDTRSGVLIELDNPKSVLVLSDDFDNANPRVRVSRVSLDGKVLWTTEVRETRSMRREQLKVVSANVHKGKQLVLFIDDRYAAQYQWPVFTPCYAMSIDLASGNQNWTMHF